MGRLLSLALAAWLAMSGAAWGQTTQPTSAPSAQIRQLVAQLGHKQWAVREAAYRKLQAIRDPAIVPALREAAASPDLEASLRAKGLLAG
ncbi:MAG: HEAT repeat domain-containing protein, partial [Planctomycetota bacterium]|nr:HEAT repeat domain-containing protein [Planctomycetota bacterium]